MKSIKSYTKQELFEQCRLQAETIDAKDKEIASLNNRIKLSEDKAEHEKAIEKLKFEHKKELNRLEQKLSDRLKMINMSMSAHNNLLKSLQGTLDNSIDLNSHVSKTIEESLRE